MIVTVTPNPGLDRTLTVPHILFNQVLRAEALRLDWGGKGFNVSRALLALGVDSIAMGFVGGAAGQLLEHGLNEMGIATDFVHIEGETRTNTVITEADAERYVKVNEAGPQVSAEELAALLGRVRKTIQPGDSWLFSGSLPPGVPSDLYAQLIDVVQSSGANAALDSSGEALRLGCSSAPYLIKPNTVEAREMTGVDVKSDEDALDAAESLLRHGVELVALSRGSDGLLLASQKEVVWAKPPCVQIKNTVGAGDALLAGITWALQRKLPLEKVARWGVATGTAAAAREGVSFGSRTEVEALYGRIQTKAGKVRR